MPFYEDYGSKFHLYHKIASGNHGFMHIHPHWELLLIPTSEEVKFTVNGVVYTSNQPNLTIYAPFCMHKCEFFESHKSIERFVCYFGEDTFRNYPTIASEYAHIIKQPFIMIPLSEKILEQCRTLINLFYNYVADSEEQTLLCFLLLRTVLNSYSNEFSDIKTNAAPLITRIIKYMHEHLAENLDADTVANEFHISRSTLDKTFQKNTTISFRQLLIEIRLSYAAYLLVCRHEFKINDVARLSGFENQNHFFVQFKKAFQATPCQYQKEPFKYWNNVKA